LFAPTRAALVATLLAFLALGTPAYAAETDTQPSVATLRAQADAMATRYFDALSRYQSLGLAIAQNRQQTGALVTRARKARHDARVRAVLVYRTSPSRVASIVASADALNAARRVRFIDQLNGRDQAIFDRLRAATRDLKNHRRALQRDLNDQEEALGNLRSQSAAIDAKLAAAQQQEQAQVAALAAAAAAASAAPASGTTDAAGGTGATPSDGSQPATSPLTAPTLSIAAAPETLPATTSAPVTQAAPPPTEAPAAPAAPAAPVYQGTTGTHPHHDDPFLSCVRQRESGGNYGIVSSDGLYYGAYQFLKTSWNSTANHAGRPELVGVPPNQASVYDQDDMAWDLYQWQGAGPWGGHCP
jgi:hypothetical protein